MRADQLVREMKKADPLPEQVQLTCSSQGGKNAG